MSGMLISLIIQIISGAIGGNVAAGAAKNIDLGTIGNTIAGAIGGGAGGQLLGMLIPLLANSASTPDIGSIIGQAAGGGVARRCPHRDCRRAEEPHRLTWLIYGSAGMARSMPESARPVGRASGECSRRIVRIA